MTLDWEEDLKEEEEGKEQDKEEDNFCGMQILKNRIGKLRNIRSKEQWQYDPTKPKPSSVDTFTPKSSKSSIKQLDNQSSVSPEVEDIKIDTLATLLGHKTQRH